MTCIGFRCLPKPPSFDHLKRFTLIVALCCILPAPVFPEHEQEDTKHVHRMLQQKADPFQAALFSDEVIELGAVLSTPWRDKEASWWCAPSYVEERPSGLLYVKCPKAASTTTAGIAHRIAQNVGMRMGGESICHVKYKEGTAQNLHYGERDRVRSYLWTMVRDPTERAVSHFFQDAVTRDGKDPTDENFLLSLHNVVPNGSGGYQLRYISPKKFGRVDNSAYAERVVARVMNEYDFIGVADRYEESIVALRLLLGLEAGDIAYLLSRVSGMHFDDHCVQYHSGSPSSEVASYLKSSEWKDRNVGDFILYDAANKKLDRTIESIGADNFKKAVFEHRKLMVLVREKCMKSAVYPCTKGVDRREESQSDCYWGDSGCGYPCIDRIVKEYELLFNSRR